MMKITEREREILKILQNDPMISQEELAELVGITRSAVAVHISNLIKKGFILGRGYVFNDKTGILVIGRIEVEVLISPGAGEGGTDIVEMRPGGTGYFTARYLTIQNIPCSLMGVTGRDGWGEMFAEEFKKSGIDSRHMIIQKEFPTSSKIILQEPDGTAKTLFLDNRAERTMTVERLDTLGVAHDKCRMLVMDTGIPVTAFRHITELARDAGVAVCVRVSGESGSYIKYEDMSGLTIVTMERQSAEKLSGMEIRDFEEGIRAGIMINKMGAETASIVIPDQGIAVTGPRGNVTIPLLPGNGLSLSKTVDVSFAGLVAGAVQGYDYRQSVSLGLGMSSNCTE